MEIKNCKRCNRIFNYIAGKMICPACKDEMEAQFGGVKDYMSEHKNAGINEISENCGVTNNQIRQWIREERLTFGEDSPIGIDCEGCGTIIKSGRFCAKCKTDLTRGLLDLTKKEEPEQKNDLRKSQSAKMRFLEK